VASFISLRRKSITIGIYCLRFEGTDRVYVGQSINIEKRYKQHLQSVRAKSANEKLQEAFKLFGVPKLLVLTECEICELDDLEEEAIILYNSVDNGFNIYRYATEAPVMQGFKHSLSKYTEEDIIKVIPFLHDITKSLHDIASLTGINESTLSDMINGKHHINVIPEYKNIFEDIRNSRYGKHVDIVSIKLGAKNKGITYPKIKSPSGEIFEIDNAYRFAKERGLAGNHFQEVLNGHRKSHKGWKLCQ
jgi:group I intron endonuclease